MVFIEEKYNYFSWLEDKPKQKALIAMVSDENCQPMQNDLSETDEIYYSSIYAIKNGLKEDFNVQYGKISKRKVIKDSMAPFIHDDFLVFTLIIGVLKFECEKKWLFTVIRHRAKNTITTTFESLLTENYQSTENMQSLILIAMFLLNKSKITNEWLVDAYNGMNDTNKLFNGDFIRIINYRAFDIIIQYKLPRNTDEVSRLLEFESRFKKRINIFSYLIYNGILLMILAAIYKILHQLPEDLKSKINEIGVIVGLGGVGFFSSLIPILRKKFRGVVLKLFGYRIT